MGKSRIIEATVFPESAMITRSMDVDLKTGENSVEFSPLPSGIRNDSIRVSIDSGNSVKINGVSVTRHYLDSSEEEKISQLEKGLEELKNRLTGIEVEIEFCKNRLQLLDSVTELSFSRFMDEFYCGKRPPALPLQLTNLYLENSGKIDEEIIQHKKRKNDIEKDIVRTENQLSLLAGMTSREITVCRVIMTAESASTVCVYMKYLVDDAGWEPVYDARFLAGRKKLEISYYGTISQHGGENWDDIGIRLSSNITSASQELPEPETWFIGTSGEDILYSPDSRGSSETARGVNAEFIISENQSIPADGTEKKVLIGKKAFSVETSYQSYPAASESVYMKGKFTNSAEYPMLRGKVRVYHDSDFIGESSMKTVVPGEEVELSLGIDDSVRIRREILRDFTGKKGITGGYTRRSYRYRIMVENFKREAAEVSILENIPVSRDGEIRVELNDPGGGTGPNHRGIIEWRLNLDPDEKKRLEIEYQVDHPINSMVTGLEL